MTYRREKKLLWMAWAIEGLALAASIFWAQNLAVGGEKGNRQESGRNPASVITDSELKSPVSVAPSWYNDTRVDFAEVKGRPRDLRLLDAQVRLMGQFEKNSAVPYLRPSDSQGIGKN